eukprot:gene33523-41371_t
MTKFIHNLELYKYPSTQHLERSQLQKGDVPIAKAGKRGDPRLPYAALAGRFIVVEEKLDGANAGVSFSPGAELLLQSRGHYLAGGGRERQFGVLKRWAAAHEGALLERLGDRYLMYGEWMGKKHSVFYNNLPHLFCEFDIYDRAAQAFLSTAARRALLGAAPVLPEAEKRNADLVVSQRKAQAAKWVLDIHTPSLPPQTYRLGDLRLECRVYLAIEWGTWKGRRIMDIPTKGATTPPMDRLCSGPESIFINTRPWPRLQAYVITENGRSKRTELNGLQIASAPFMLKMANEAGVMPWSDDALVEFAFYDTSHWSKPIAAETPK